MEVQNIDRRGFIGRAGAALAGLTALGLATSCQARSGAVAQAPSKNSGPDNPSWQATLVSTGEPGEALIVSGRIFGPDAITPLSGITLYVYHTDAKGIYSEQRQDGRGERPVPRLQGWMRTGADGRYEFRTIKPASYPGSTNPAHIHSSASGAGYRERWIDEFWFEGDPFINEEGRARFAGLGSFSPIMAIKRAGDGVYRCTRDIRLERT
jgi:protocatechuate 3,4-dioxygenase beta subunit